ncbi:MAG: hexitol phosphatase HxpB [Deltaproteobacteria bacterium]|nr:hexitol phosphatase HxpB [Deltaproteobacteria bacterium]
MIRAAIFDMDGLLLDSEPLWTRAEMEVFGSLGIRLEPADCARTVGMGLAEVVALRHAEHPWRAPDQAEVAARIHARVVALLGAEGRAMPGAREALAFFRRRGLKLGLATASDAELVSAGLGAAGLAGGFDFVQSAAELPYGKPHPMVYLRAAEGLGVEPGACVALEDSIPGLIAAKAARMKAVAVPARRDRADPRLAIADLRLDSLESIDEALWARLSAA